MFGGIAIAFILFILMPKVFNKKNLYTEENMDKPRKNESFINYYDAKTYVEYMSNLSQHEISAGEGVIILLVSGVIFFFIGAGIEVLFADILDSIVSAMLGLFVFPFCAAMYVLIYFSGREDKSKELHNKLCKYISWSQEDKEFLAADCFFCNLIMEGKITDTELTVIKNFRDHCRKKDKVVLISAENYFRALNVIRKKKGFKTAYDSLFKRIDEEKKKLTINEKKVKETGKKSTYEDIVTNVRNQFEKKASNYNTKEIITDDELLEMLHQYTTLNLETDLFARIRSCKYQMNDSLFDFLMDCYIAKVSFNHTKENHINDNETQLYKEKNRTYMADPEGYENLINIEMELEGLEFDELSITDELELNDDLEASEFDSNDYDLDIGNKYEYLFEENQFGDIEMYDYNGELKDY